MDLFKFKGDFIMKKFILATTVLAAMALSSCSVTINGNDIEVNGDWKFTKTKSQTLSIEPEKATKLDVNIDVGKISVEYGDTKNVDVDVKFTSNGVNEDKVSATIESAKIITDVKNNTVYIKSAEKDFDTRFVNLTADLEITLPSEFSDFNIESDVGDVHLNKLKGSFDVTADVGDINLKSLVGDFSITADVGNIECDDLSITDDSGIKADVGNIDISLESVDECNLQLIADVGDIDVDTQGLDYEEKSESKDYVGKKQVVVIDDKCNVTLKADVGTVKVTK